MPADINPEEVRTDETDTTRTRTYQTGPGEYLCHTVIVRRPAQAFAVRNVGRVADDEEQEER